jgi:glycosyltransferase involved in cell wall biosynthesis
VTAIVHQVDPRHPIAGGIESVITGIIRYAPREHAVIVVGADRSGTRALELGELVWHDGPDGEVGFLPVARLGRDGRSGVLPETLLLAFGLLRFRRVLRRVAGTLQVHRSELGAVLTVLLPRVPRVQCIHGDSNRALRRRSGSYWRFLRTPHLALERWSVRHARWTYVFSRSGAARLARELPRVSYLPTWYDPAVVVERTTPSARPPMALWVGRFEEEKDPRLALDVLQRFVARAGGRRAVMIGDGALLTEVARARTRAAGVDLPGRRDPREVAVAMSEADVLLMTSHFEGSPVVMNEALAAGTPVVATDESDPDGRIEQQVNGVRVAGREPDALADALEAAYTLDRGTCVESVRDLAAPRLVPRLFEAPDSSR